MGVIKFIHGQIIKLTGRKKAQELKFESYDTMSGRENSGENSTIIGDADPTHPQHFREHPEHTRMHPGHLLRINKPPEEMPSKRVKPRKYEASFYYLRVEPPDPEYEIYTRLHDLYFEMPDIAEAFKYAQEVIQNPGNDESWERVLSERFIPYNSLQWNEFEIQRRINDENPDYACLSKPFISPKGDKYIIKIEVYPEEPEVKRGRY